MCGSRNNAGILMKFCTYYADIVGHNPLKNEAAKVNIFRPVAEYVSPQQIRYSRRDQTTLW